MLSLGVLAELWLEFQEFEVVAPTVLARVPLETYPLLVFLAIDQVDLKFVLIVINN